MENNRFEENTHYPHFPDLSNFSGDFQMEDASDLNQEAQVFSMEEDDSDDSLADSMICDSGSRLVPNGFTNPNSPEEIMFFVNAGAVLPMESDSGICFLGDKYFEGGDTFQTEEFITEGGDHSFIYQSARLGNFSYCIENLPPGDYLLDLHFVEIINTCGPKGMRVFNVFMQDEKLLSGFDIFSIVGANKPLQLVGARASVKDDGLLVLRFEGSIGSPVVSGICIRRNTKISALQKNSECLACKKCSTEVENTSAQKKVQHMKLIAKYEKRIQDLKDTLKHKTDECYQSWMSWTAANEQLANVRMELDNKISQTRSLDQTVDKQAERLRDISSKYGQQQKSWTLAINKLEQKVKVMKQEQMQLSREAHECTDSIPDLNKMVFAVQSLVEQCEDLKVKYNDEQAKRRKLHNEVQEAKGNIRVFCRCRPLSKQELVSKCSSVVDFDAAKDGELGIIGQTKKSFKFDRVYTPKDNQADVFADAAPMVISVLDGYNVCIFAYGQTGTGKTFTMEGTDANRGVNYRTLEELFRIANERSETNAYSISVSVLEVYNEQIRDLLSTETSKKLEIKQTSDRYHYIPGLVEAKVDNINDVWNVLRAGSSARAVGSNNVNEHSSRSHCMLSITAKAKNLMTGESTNSKLWLVDLAGSERLAKTDVQGERLKEAQNINRSLSALGDVISSLANKSSHIPYRNSKLTHLLQDSLGGDSKTLMFVQISPSDQDLSETLSSLNFATRVRGVELGPVRKQIDTSELQKLKGMLDKAKQESRSKDEALKKLEENLQNIENKARGKDQVHRNQVDKIKELEGQLEMKTSIQYQSEKQVSQLSEKLKGKEDSYSKLQQKAMDLETRLKQQEENQSLTYQRKVNDLENKLREQLQEAYSSSLILEHKVKDLERKLKEHEENPEMLSLQQKVKDLERKLKEQEENPEMLLLCQKVKDLERKLNEQEDNPETLSLHQKITELEEKVREQEIQLASTTIHSESTSTIRSTPMEIRESVKERIINEAEHRILKSLNTVVTRRVSSQGPSGNFVKENEPPHYELRRKRLSRTGETDNNIIVPTPVSDNKSKDFLDMSKKPLPRFPKTTTKPVGTVQTTKPLVRSKTSRDPVQAVKERDSKKRMWTR